MKKLSFNSTLNHMRDGYNTYYVSVEKVVTLYGNEFLRLKNDTLDDNYWIARYHKLMRIDINDIAHCVLFVDNKSGDGILVDSEGEKYARKSQFIPNVRALIENNEQTEAEAKIHKMIKEITKGIAVKAHCGNKYICFEDVLNQETMNEIKTAFIQAVGEMLEQHEDIRSVQINELDIPFQSEIEVEAKPLQTEKEMEISRNEEPKMNLKM